MEFSATALLLGKRGDLKKLTKSQKGLSLGFTLLELLIAVSIIGLFTAIIFPAFGGIRGRAEKVVCIGNLRSLHASLASYLNDNKQWPQVPEEFTDAQLPRFWVETLKDYGANQAVWTCPTLSRQFKENPANFLEYPEIHYMPAEFDDKPATPRKWPNMPWVIEVGSMHGGGNYIIRADGGMKEMNELIQEAMAAGSTQPDPS